ncbi:MAG: 2-succinyl-5-enolpyruvyl-6-hydroxy-3-cyclohexene-1-carboxylic-acid synthase [Lutibacter sp.]
MTSRTSSKKLAQLIVGYCRELDLSTIVISPGSRNAPLIIGFTENSFFKTLSVVDERSAAFFALGIAQQTQKPVGLVCTSGSALLNYYPAIAEAFYSNIPLVVISADRPIHLIDIGDGQTIRQENVFENHILYSANLGYGNETVLIENALKTAIYKKGPVHINVPFDEPLYDVEEGVDLNVKLINKPIKNTNNLLSEEPLSVTELEKYAAIWNHSTKKMVIVGAHFPDELLQTQLTHLSKDPSVLILIENTANVCHSKFINSIDKLIFPFAEDELENFQPEILITLGGLIVSKKIKKYLREYKPKHHWHVHQKISLNTFLCLSHHFKISATLFFSQFFFLTRSVESNYQRFWLNRKQKRLKNHEQYLSNCDFSDLKVFDIIIEKIPKNYQLQLSNSSIIRYSQLFDIHSSIHVFCNRGTSGIDGSTSTAVGAAYASNEKTLFITGDISFFYDSNGLWNNYIPNSFRIIVINNSGGGIFKFIPGPSSTNALNYFNTPHQLKADKLCEMYHINYSFAENEKDLVKELKCFFDNSEMPKLLEIKTPNEVNDKILKAYFKYLNI